MPRFHDYVWVGHWEWFASRHTLRGLFRVAWKREIAHSEWDWTAW